MRRSLMDAAGGFRSAFDGSRTDDLALRCMERATRVTHIPRVPYQLALGGQLYEPRKTSCAAWTRHGGRWRSISIVWAPAETLPWKTTAVRIHYCIPREKKVSLIVLDSGEEGQLRRCLAALQATDWPEMETLILSNRQELPGRTIAVGEIGRFAALNLGAGEATGDYLAFEDSSVVVEDPGWLRELMMLAQREDILAAIPALFDGRGRILHAGYALGRGTERPPAASGDSPARRGAGTAWSTPPTTWAR